MNRLEMVSLFTSLKYHAKKKDLEAIEAVIDTVLREAGVKEEDTSKVKEEDTSKNEEEK